jgi:hypothetical protein
MMLCLKPKLVDSTKDARVSLMDDGVDIAQEEIKDNIDVSGRSFDTSYMQRNDCVKRAHHSCSMGRGTVTANMIRRVCPQVKICSYD